MSNVSGLTKPSHLLQAALRLLFVVLIAYPVVWGWLGMRVRHRGQLPRHGPAIIAANHNSHLDILALLTLFPLRQVGRVQPAAAADYFLAKWWRRWFARYVIGIIPVRRGGLVPGETDPLAECYAALAAGQVLVVFPEGTRGEPEQLGELKPGIWYLAQQFPAVPVVPVYLHGLGRAMPKGRLLPAPFPIRAAVGYPLPPAADKATFIATLRGQLEQLQQQVYSPRVRA